MRVVRDLEAGLASQVPVGKALIFTLGAPIKVPKQLVAALTKVGTEQLRKGGGESDESRTILGNRVRFGVVNYRGKLKTRVFGFVFTAGPQPIVFAKTLLEQ